MTTVKLNWSVPAEEWERFERYVEYKHGKTKGYIGREAELAMQEYAETDDWAGVEDLVDRLVQAAGRSAGGEKRKNNSLDVGADGESTRAYCRVSKDVKEEFSAHVKQTDKRLGIAFAHACQLRREGGRPDRVQDKLERVVEDAEALLGTQADTQDSNSMGKKERQTVQVINYVRDEHLREGDDLPDVFPKWWVEDAIEELMCDRQTDPEQYYIPTYMDEVKDRLGYVTNPDAKAQLIREENVGKVPAFERKSYSELSTEERIEAIHIDLGRRARENDGLRQFTVEDVRKHTFDGKPRKSAVKTFVERAGEHGGYSTRVRHGKLRLKCKLEEVADEQLLEHIHNGEVKTIDDDEQQTITPDDGVDADDIWQAQEEATARTDGGK